MSSRPNYFLLGAPKSGTTALNKYLQSHPQVLFSEPKEPNHFSTDLRPSAYASDADYVAQCFPDIEKYDVAVEGSTLNLVSEVAVDNILRFNPDAKFIVMLRHPVDMFVSWYHHMYAATHEKHQTMRGAWRAQSTATPADGVAAFATNYRAICSTGAQVERLLGKVSRDRVHFIFFDEFTNDPQREYVRVLEFFGLPDDGREQFPVVNVSRATGSQAMHLLLRAWFKFRGLTGIRLGIGQTQLVQKIFFGRKRPISDELRHELRTVFREDIQLLAKLTGRDLSHWV